MEGHGRKRELLEEVLEKDRLSKFVTEIEKLAVIDAFVQFSQNATSLSAGYGVDNSYPLIGQNLAKRYGLGRAAVETILTFLKESLDKLRKVDYDVYFWRQAIGDHIRERHAEEFVKWHGSLYKDLSEDGKRKFLVLLYALSRTSSTRDLQRWYVCFFDKEEKSSENDLKRLLVELGLGSVLYYKSSSGYEENRFTPSYFQADLCKTFEKETPIVERQIREVFDGLTLANMKLLDRCVKEAVPVLESRMGKVTQTSSLIIESSKSYFAVSPFALEKFQDLIKARKVALTREWKEKFDGVLDCFVKEAYPCAELKILFEIEGAHCWEIKYSDSPEKEPIGAVLLLSPYIFLVSGYTTILDEMRRAASSPLNLIFLISETLPSVFESFRYVSQRNLIFLLDETGQSFYVLERSQKLPEDKALAADSFLSGFLGQIEKQFQLGRTWPMYLQEYMENLRYLNRFPRLMNIRNEILRIGLGFRNAIRRRLQTGFGSGWKERVREQMLEMVQKLEAVVEKRPDKEEVKDFLDGATLGELVKIARTFPDILGIDKSGIGHLDSITQHRKVLEHPLKDQESDLDEKTYNTLRIALEYVEKVICLE